MLVGVVGKANTGKSTFFKALTLAEAEIANYPFATIKPNHGVGHVRIDCAGRYFNVQCNPKEGYCLNNNRFVPVELLDVAGLVPGAHQGKGLGNQFLDDLRQASVLIHIVDAAGSTNEKGEPVQAGSYNPANDIRFLEHELDMWYIQILKRPWERFAKQSYLEKQKVDKAIAKQFSGLNVTEGLVAEIINRLGLNPENATKWSEEDLKNFAVELRKKTKPLIVAANKMDVPAAKDNLEKLRREFPEHLVVPCSAESELALKEAAKHGLISYVAGDKDFEILKPNGLNDEQRAALEFVKTNVLQKLGSTGVQEVLNRAVLELLRYVAVYPVANSKLQDKDGNTLPDCYMVPEKTTALEFAFKVHTDLGKGFIRAVDMRTKQVIGKDYRLKHGDVIEIVSGK
jgi:hypothetical protein